MHSINQPCIINESSKLETTKINKGKQGGTEPEPPHGRAQAGEPEAGALGWRQEAAAPWGRVSRD